MKVVAHKEETFDTLMSRFKKSVQSSGVLMECKKRKYFMNDNELRKFKAENSHKKKRR